MSSPQSLPDLPVAPSRPDVKLRLMRRAVVGFAKVSDLMRRRAKLTTPVTEFKYGLDPAERVEYIAPRAGTAARAPVIYIHGGGWVLLSKECYSKSLGFLAEAGHPVFNLEYPLAPENPHPGVLKSLIAALDWIAREYPNVSGYHVMGDSAGGNLAMMIGLLASNPALVADVDPNRTAGLSLECHSVVSLYGVLDRLSWIEDGFPGADMMMENYAGKGAFGAEVSRELAITPMDLDFKVAPPSLLTVGSEDPLLRSSRLFAERLEERSAKVTLREYPGEGHGFFNLGKSESAPQMAADILEFLRSVDPFSA